MSDLKDLKQPETVIFIDKKEYKVIFDYEAFEILENLTEKSIDELEASLRNGKATLREKMSLLKAGLNRYHKDFDISEVTQKVNFIEILNKNLKDMVTAFYVPFLSPEILNKIYIEEDKKNSKKKTLKESAGQKSTP